MAVKKREAKPPEGAPAWMCTYGDMVTLLLTFFVMLLSMSEIKQDQRLQEFVDAIREAFGYIGGVQTLPLDTKFVSQQITVSEVPVPPLDPKSPSKSPDEGLRGKRPRVTEIRKGERYAVGGKLQFGKLTHELDEDQVREIAEFADMLRGHKTIIEVHGHCSRVPVAGTGYADHFDLAWRRASAVKDYLIKFGIDPSRILIAASGVNQPAAARAWDAQSLEANDFVEIIQQDQLITEDSD